MGYSNFQITRRDWLKFAGTLPILPLSAYAEDEILLRFGMVTDSHYADEEVRGSRHYRESLPKMRECVELMNQEQVDFLIELGDLKDQNYPPEEKKTLHYLKQIESVLAEFRGLRYHVLGNHDMDSLSKTQVLQSIVNTGIASNRSYYSFDRNGCHFVVLDANYKRDGREYDHGNFEWTDANIPEKQLRWLSNDLKSTEKPTIVFVHQLLDGKGDVFVNNAEEVRNVLEESNQVLAVFQGHQHSGQYNQIHGIHYYTLKAVVEGSGEENNSYAVVDVYAEGLLITGYRKAVSKALR